MEGPAVDEAGKLFLVSHSAFRPLVLTLSLCLGLSSAPLDLSLTVTSSGGPGGSPCSLSQIASTLRAASFVFYHS